MSAKQEDKAFFKAFGIVMAIVGFIAVSGLVAALIIGSTADNYEGLRPKEVMLTQKRTDPVYRVVTEATAVQTVAKAGKAGGGAGHAMKSGEEVFKSLCHTCHVPGLMGAPQVSNTAEWKRRFPRESRRYTSMRFMASVPCRRRGQPEPVEQGGQGGGELHSASRGREISYHVAVTTSPADKSPGCASAPLYAVQQGRIF